MVDALVTPMVVPSLLKAAERSVFVYAFGRVAWATERVG